MKRRTFVTALVTGTSVALSGCIAGDSGAEDGNGDDSAAGGGTGGTTESPTDGSEGSGGSSDSGGSGDSDGSDGTGGSGGDGSPSVSNTELAPKQECSGSNGASVEFASEAVVAVGCIRGPNGCHVPVLEDATVNGDVLRITVTTEKEGGSDTMCTQAIVNRGYEATVSMSGGMPATVEVVHVSMDETKTVATAEN